MSRPRFARRAGLAAAVAALAVGGPAWAATPPDPSRSGVPDPDQWIVELDDEPAARYDGGVPGLARTAPRGTERFDSRAPAVRRYVSHLARRETAVLGALPGVKVDARYRHAFAGFAARLSPEQVREARRTPGVRRVVRERFLELASAGAAPAAAGRLAGSEAELLGLPDGLWARLGGAANAGRGIIVGVVDTGITPEAEAFADRGLEPPPVWNGACEAGERFAASSCNDKLIGARAFLDGWRSPEDGTLVLPESYDSPRDDDGHGTHVAATAAGNRGIDPAIGTNDLGVDRITGVAPAAHVAAYKACLYLGCSSIDIVAAIDRAVADGVDVLNLSLGGSLDPAAPVDPMQLALLNADAAGVFVAVSAGNSGDAPDAIGTPAVAPWTTAVGATSSTRTFRSTLRAVGPAGREVVVPASSVSAAIRRAPLLDARTLDTGEREPCYFFQELTPERVRGKVVICNSFAPLDLISGQLADAGAAGLVLVVPDHTEDPAPSAVLPTFFVKERDATALRDLVREGPTTVTAGRAAATPWPADRVAWFSSRGPSSLVEDLLRPDVSAPGVNVLSAVAPITPWTECCAVPEDRFGVLSGTSMASPHVAGVAALLTQLRPTWSSATMRSALVTTARPAVASDGAGPGPLQAAGGGRIDPQAAADPGLVVEPTTDEYRRFAEGLDPAAIPGDPEPIAARDLNLPSLAADRVSDFLALERTVTSVDDVRARWSATLEGWEFGELEGYIAPGEFTIAPGQRQTIRAHVAAWGAARDFRDAAVLLRNQQTGRTVRLPLAVRNRGLMDAPQRLRVTATGPDGSQVVPVTIAGEVDGQALGLARPRVQDGIMADDLDDSWGRVFRRVVPLRVDAGTALLSVRVTPPADMIGGVSVFRDVDRDGLINTFYDEFVGRFDREDPWGTEQLRPVPGDYLIQVSGSADAPFAFDLRTWLVADPRPDDPAPAPGLVVAGDPQFAFPASEQPFELRWSGVDGTEELRGVVAWRNPNAPAEAADLATTIVEVAPAQAAAKATAGPRTGGGWLLSGPFRATQPCVDATSSTRTDSLGRPSRCFGSMTQRLISSPAP
jgi:subtilisin family serine protease